MSFSALAIAAIGLGLVGVLVAVCAGVLVCFGRRRQAQRLLPAFLAVLAAGTMVSFAAVVVGPHDLQRQAERTLTYASAAERTVLARSGRYTMSVWRLVGLNRSLKNEVKVDGATLAVTPGPGAGNVTLLASLGPGTHAQATLHGDGRLEKIARHGSPTRSRRRLALAGPRRRAA
jgi:hypothetical protein